MAKDFEAERQQIEAEEAKLKARRKRLAEMEKAEAGKHLANSGLGKLLPLEIDALSTAIKMHGIGEILKRVA